jgi:hypothetical protein
MGEQQAVLSWAAGKHGSFVDLGCYDGETYSNTAAIADLGWPGVCVDAAPDAAGACARRYAARDDVEVIVAAFSAEASAGPVTIHWSPDAMYTAAVASERDDVVLVPVSIPRLDLGWFAGRVAALPAPLFCSIDLEGLSLQALGWLLEHAEPECVCVEANTDDERETVRQMLAGWQELQLPRLNYVNLLFAQVPA